MESSYFHYCMKYNFLDGTSITIQKDNGITGIWQYDLDIVTEFQDRFFYLKGDVIKLGCFSYVNYQEFKRGE